MMGDWGCLRRRRPKRERCVGRQDGKVVQGLSREVCVRACVLVCVCGRFQAKALPASQQQQMARERER